MRGYLFWIPAFCRNDAVECNDAVVGMTLLWD